MSVQLNRQNRAFVENCISDALNLRNQLNRLGMGPELQGVLNDVMHDLEIIYSINHTYEENIVTAFQPSQNIPEYTAEAIPHRVSDLAQLVHLALGTLGYRSPAFEVLGDEDVSYLGEVRRNLEEEFDDMSDLPELIPFNEVDMNPAVLAEMFQHFDGFYINPSRIPAPKMKSKVLNKTQLNAVVEDACSICFENHVKRETYACVCKHSFGQSCFQGWMDTQKKLQREVNCPLCRAKVPVLKSFREKAKKRKGTAAAAAAATVI